MVSPIEEKIAEIKNRAKGMTKEEYLASIKDAMGPISQKILEKTIEFEGWTSCGWGLFGSSPPIIDRGEGATLWDVDGNKYIDLVAGFGVEGVGYSHPKLIKTIEEQSKKIIHYGEMPNEPRARAAEELSKLAPGSSRKKVHFAITGAEAVETALKIARYYTGRPDILTFFGTYHGRIFGAATASSLANVKFHHWPMTTRHGVLHVPYPYCYRCIFKKEYPECDLYCAKFVEELFTSSSYGLRWPEAEINNVAAMLLEPTQGTAGNIIPPREWLAEMRKIADKYDLLLIDDEIYCSWGRTGKWWACQHSNVEPDIITTSKAICGGLPFSAIIAKEEISDNLPNNFVHSTFSGYQLGCTVALTMIEIFKEEKLVERSAQLGEYFLKALKELQSSHECIGDVDGLGLWLRMELVKDKKTKEPAIKEAEILQKRCMKRGLLFIRDTHQGNSPKMLPPLVIEKEQIDKAIQILDTELKTIFH